MTTPTLDAEIVILGAGLAGLAARQRLDAAGLRATTFEAEPIVGGMAATRTREGFSYDRGPHVSFTKNEAVKALFAAATDANFQEFEARLLNRWGRHWIPHPVHCHLHGLPHDLVARAIVDFVSALHAGDDAPVTDYERWCRTAFGDTLAETFAVPYTRKYWAADARELGVDWIGDRVHRPTLEQVVTGALSPQHRNYHYISTFRYPRVGGFATYARAMAPADRVFLGHRAVAIDARGRRIDFAQGLSAHYEELVSSIPLPELVKLLRDVPSHVSAAVAELSATSLVLVTVGARGEPTGPVSPWMYFYDDDVAFSRASCPHLLSRCNAPRGAWSIQLEIYASRYRPFSIDNVAERCVEDLTRLGILQRPMDVIFVDVEHVDRANVLFDHARGKALATVNAYLDGLGIVRCGRYGEWKYLWSDDSVVSGWSAADEIVRRRRAR